MKYSVMVEYALHSLTYLVDVPSNYPIGIKDLSEFQGLSETYLSKVFGKLTKAGIVHSVPGVNGGYKLAKKPEEISFWDVILAVEGIKPIFQCKNIKAQIILNKEQCSDCISNTPCLINVTMLEAENHMQAYLKTKTLAWLNSELDRTLSQETRAKSRMYFIDK